MTMELKKLFEVSEGLNEQMVNIILSTLKDNHEDGMDYLKFKQSIQNLMNMNMDETTSIKSAYATASTMGLSKDSLSKSINNYLNIINKERDKFIETLKKQVDHNIEQPKSEINEINEKIKANEVKMASLAKENELLTNKITTVNDEIQKAEVKIENRRSEFLSVYEAFVKNLNDDKSFFENNL